MVSDVVTGTAAVVVPAELAGIAGLTGDAVPFAAMPAWTLDKEASGTGEEAETDLEVATVGLPFAAVTLGEALAGAELVSFFCAAICCCLMRSFR